jgi:CubicO group peptidase (beta-lactamase class C family)
LNRRDILTSSIAAALTFGLRAQSKSPARPDIDDLVTAEVGPHSESAGIVAVLLDGASTHLVARGHSGTLDNSLLASDTTFEIGSLTKVFTALLLADMSARGEVAMTDPVVKYLPDFVRLPQLREPISLIDLATYTSGLPNIPRNLKGDLRNPYAGYTADDLYAFLGELRLKYEPGTHYAYANIGFGLLGIALARRAGKSYEELMVERVCNPLNLHSTRITLTEEMRGHLAQGHDDQFNQASLWDLPALASAGAVRSTAKDMTVFLRACLGVQRTSLDPSFKRLLETRRPTGIPGTEVGLGWFISSDSSDEIVWKSGRTGGFAANIAFSTRTRRGSIVLANGPFDAISLGLKLISPGFRPRNLGALFG